MNVLSPASRPAHCFIGLLMVVEIGMSGTVALSQDSAKPAGRNSIGIEFVRVPDRDPGYLAFGWLTMGQVLTLPVLVTGIVLIWMAYRKPSLG